MSAEAIRCIDAFLGSTRRVQHQASRFEAALSRHLLTKGSRPHSTRRTPLGDLPESWEILSLGEVAQLASGRTKPSGASRVPSPSCSVPIYGPRGRIGFSEKSLRSGPTVVVGRVGRYCGSVHYVAEASCWVTDAALFVYEARPEVDLRFLFHALQQLDLPSLRRPGRQPLISLSTIYPLPVALPPLEEQREICRLLESVLRVREAQDRVLEQAARLRSVLLAAPADLSRPRRA
jgi:type I restriction enzyme S subunit